MKPRLLFALFVVALASSAFSFESILVNQNYINMDVTPFSDYLTSNDEGYSILQVTKPNIARQFSPIHSNILNYSQLGDTTWLTFAVNNPTGRPIDLFLSFEAPYLDSIELFYDLDNPLGYKRVSTGIDTPYSKRPYQMGNFVLPFDVSAGQQQLYIKISSKQAANIQIRLMDENTLLKNGRAEVQLNTLIASLLLCGLGILLVSFYRYRVSISLWASLVVFGVMLNLAGWTGGIAWWVTGLSMVEIAANNIGAYLAIMGLSQLLIKVRTDSFTSWLADWVLWLGRVMAVFALLACFPISGNLLAFQIVLFPISFALLSFYCFEQRPNSFSERLALMAFGLLLIYFICTTLILIGLMSAFGSTLILLSILAFSAAVFLTWTGWLASKTKGARVAVEGMAIPNVHWPLLRKLNHEIRGPINGVLGMAELLQDTTLSAHQLEYVTTIQTAGFSLLREADQLQNLIRIGLNRLPESEDEFDLYDLIEDTVQPFSRIAHSKQLELVLDIAQELPSRYLGNAHIIGQILSNLLDNALKYTDHGEVLIQIKPWQNQRLRFSITDTGPGISKDSRGSLFNFPDPDDIHQQQPKDVHLGLPISKYLVGLLGGHLSLSSELRMGTTFWIDLPLHPLKAEEIAIPEEADLNLEDLRLMVVDDNLTCRKVIEHLAMSWESEVLTMSNGQSALANLHNQFHKGEAVDVLILDQNMPSMTGLELAERIRQDKGLNRDIVIIMMTGADDISSEFSDNEVGIEYVMSKPISARTLKQILVSAKPSIKKNRDKYNAKNSLFF